MSTPRIVEKMTLDRVLVDGEGDDPGYLVGARLNYRGTPMVVTERVVIGPCWFYTFERGSR